MAGYFKRPHSFDFEVQSMITVFMGAIRNIIISRFNQTKVPLSRIKVRFVYAPKQRVLNDLLDKDQNLILPVVACYITGLNRDINRVFNKIEGAYETVAGYKKAKNEKVPLPVDLNIGVSVLTRYQEDMDQILSHIMPYINPYFTVSWRTPNRADKEIRSNVFWDGNANITYPNDLNSTNVARVAADLNFTFKGWLFQSPPSANVGIIHDIHTYYSNDVYHGIPTEFLLDSEYQIDTDDYEYRYVKGVPPQPSTIEPYVSKTNKEQMFAVYGKSFNIINNVYLSGLPIDSISTLQNPFSGNASLSADYPAFYGYKLDVTEWKYDKDIFLMFKSPSAVNVPGFMDLIVEGPAGYGLLTENVRVNTFNPYLETSPQHSSYVPYQFPFLSGIEVIN